jgi:hypothetical protein
MAFGAFVLGDQPLAQLQVGVLEQGGLLCRCGRAHAQGQQQQPLRGQGWHGISFLLFN